MTELEHAPQAPEINSYVTVSALGAEVSPDTPFEVWRAATEGWIEASESVQIIVGDLLNFGETKFGDDFAQVIGRSERTLQNWKSICHRVPMSRRREGLEISHLSAVKSLPPEDQEKWLEKAAPESEGERPKMTVRELSEAIREEEHGKPEKAETEPCPACQGSGRIPVEEA